MTGRARIPNHAKNHLPGGSDPIEFETTSLEVTDGTTDVHDVILLAFDSDTFDVLGTTGTATVNLVHVVLFDQSAQTDDYLEATLESFHSEILTGLGTQKVGLKFDLTDSDAIVLLQNIASQYFRSQTLINLEIRQDGFGSASKAFLDLQEDVAQLNAGNYTGGSEALVECLGSSFAPEFGVRIAMAPSAAATVRSVDDDFVFARFAEDGNITFKLRPGQTFTVEDSSGNPIFRVDEDGDLHGKTGKALTFDL